MALNPSLLASEIASGIGQGAATGEVTGLATGIIEELIQNGTAAPGSPVSPITGITGSSMASKIATAAGFGSVTAELLGLGNGICNHITSSGLVTYTNAPDFTSGGTVSGLSGSAMANEIKTSAGFPSVSAQLLGLANAIANHIMTNAQVSGGIIS